MAAGHPPCGWVVPGVARPQGVEGLGMVDPGEPLRSPWPPLAIRLCGISSIHFTPKLSRFGRLCAARERSSFPRVGDDRGACCLVVNLLCLPFSIPSIDSTYLLPIRGQTQVITFCFPFPTSQLRFCHQREITCDSTLHSKRFVFRQNLCRDFK
jgi:hypothetical protein